MQIKTLGLLLACAMAIPACGEADKLFGKKDSGKNEQLEEKESAKDIGLKFSGDSTGNEGQISGNSGKNKYLPQSAKHADFRTSAFGPMAMYWPAGLNRIDAYGIMENVSLYTHFDAVTNITLPRSYPRVPIGFPESAGFLVNGMPRMDITWTPSLNPAGALVSGSFCNIGGSVGDPYYPDEMFGVGQAWGIALRNNNAPVTISTFTPAGALAPFCGRSFYRVTLEIVGDDAGGDPITATTNVRSFYTQSWDVVQGDLPLFTIVTPNVGGNGRLWTIYVISGSPILIKPEYETANPAATWRIAPYLSINSLERWNSAGVGSFVAVAACAGTTFTGAFDLDPSASTDEGYLATFNHTVAGCLTQGNSGFTVTLQAPPEINGPTQ